MPEGFISYDLHSDFPPKSPYDPTTGKESNTYRQTMPFQVVCCPWEIVKMRAFKRGFRGFCDLQDLDRVVFWVEARGINQKRGGIFDGDDSTKGRKDKASGKVDIG